MKPVKRASFKISSDQKMQVVTQPLRGTVLEVSAPDRWIFLLPPPAAVSGGVCSPPHPRRKTVVWEGEGGRREATTPGEVGVGGV